MTWQNATLTVGSEPQQRFAGFGFSFEHDNPYGLLSEERKAEVDRLLYDELDARILRLWYAAGQPEVLRDDYQASGIIPRALANGVTELLLAPAGDYPGDPDEFARRIAEDIRVMRDDYGIRITTTGVMNEPDAEDWKLLPASDYVPLTIALRRELDARGLGDVKVIGPEFASADDKALRWFDTVAADPVALASFDALGTHSYNMGATPEFASRVRAHDKQYWMTEAGGGRFDGSAEHDATFAAGVSSRFLNDLNNGVTHWVWFIGLSHGTDDVYQKLLMCEGSCADPAPDLQELRLPPRAAGQRRLSARHDHAPCHERPAGLSGHGLDLWPEAPAPRRGRAPPRRPLRARRGQRHAGHRGADRELGPADALPRDLRGPGARRHGRA